MTQAWWSANWPWLKKPVALSDKLISVEAAPHRKSWQEMKAALMLAIGPSSPKE